MDGKGKSSGEAKPGEVLKTGGEASAAAYAEVDVPEATDCPTIEVDRVRVVAPSRTPTVKIADRAKRAGPRAPDQMVKPKPKEAVELPEGRPVTKMQLIEIDPAFLLELETKREEAPGRTAEAGAAAGPMDSPWVKEAPARVRAAELPSAGGPPSAPTSAAVREKPARGGVLVVAAVLVTALVVAVAATRGPKVKEKEATSAAATSRATAASTTAEPPASVVPSAAAVPAPSATPNVAATASAAPPQAIRPPGKPTTDGGDPYGPTATPIPPKTTAEPLVPAPPTTASASALPKPSASSWGGHAPEF